MQAGFTIKYNNYVLTNETENVTNPADRNREHHSLFSPFAYTHQQ